MKNRTPLFASLLITLSLLVSACSPLGQKAGLQPSPTTALVEETAPRELSITSTQSASANGTTITSLAQSTIELTATDPKKDETALDLLKNSGAKVEMKSYGDMGSFIVSVNGKAGDAENYWAFYVNGEYAQQAADKTILKPGDRVKFIYEKVQSAPLK